MGVFIQRNTVFVAQGRSPATDSSSLPCIKCLALTTILHGSTLSEAEAIISELDYHQHTFRVDRSKRLQVPHSGIVTVPAQTMEGLESELRCCVLRTSKHFSVGSEKAVIRSRWIDNVVAEWEYDESVWADLRTEDLSLGFGHPRIIITRRTQYR